MRGGTSPCLVCCGCQRAVAAGAVGRTAGLGGAAAVGRSDSSDGLAFSLFDRSRDLYACSGYIRSVEPGGASRGERCAISRFGFVLRAGSDAASRLDAALDGADGFDQSRTCRRRGVARGIGSLGMGRGARRVGGWRAGCRRGVVPGNRHSPASLQGYVQDHGRFMGQPGQGAV